MQNRPCNDDRVTTQRRQVLPDDRMSELHFHFQRVQIFDNALLHSCNVQHNLSDPPVVRHFAFCTQEFVKDIGKRKWGVKGERIKQVFNCYLHHSIVLSCFVVSIA